MEHRYSDRFITNIRTLIYKSGLPIAVGRIVDMSSHGVFIDGEVDNVALYQPLDIEFTLEGNRMDHSSRYKCFVVRKEPRGLALSFFDDYSPSHIRHAEPIAVDTKASSVVRSADFDAKSLEEKNIAAGVHV